VRGGGASAAPAPETDVDLLPEGDADLAVLDDSALDLDLDALEAMPEPAGDDDEDPNASTLPEGAATTRSEAEFDPDQLGGGGEGGESGSEDLFDFGVGDLSDDPGDTGER
jgi:hypothetical protein